MGELFELLSYSAEGHWKSGLELDLGFLHPATGKLCQPSNKWVPVSNPGKDKAANRED